MTRIEHRTAAFLAEVERILRQIIFARGALRSGAGNVERRNVVDTFCKCVRSEERKPVAETFFQTSFERVVDGICVSGNFADRRKCAWICIRPRAAREQSPAVSGGLRRIAGLESRRVGLDEARQLCAFRSDVAGVEKPVRAERTLEIQIPILRVRKF